VDGKTTLSVFFITTFKVFSKGITGNRYVQVGKLKSCCFQGCAEKLICLPDLFRGEKKKSILQANPKQETDLLLQKQNPTQIVGKRWELKE